MSAMICDFCGLPNPKYQFANPQMRCRVLAVEFEAGHFAACADCAILLEDGKLTELIDRSLDTHSVRSTYARILAANELLSVYSRISRQREPL
jgi:hypothetical protein